MFTFEHNTSHMFVKTPDHTWIFEMTNDHGRRGIIQSSAGSRPYITPDEAPKLLMELRRLTPEANRFARSEARKLGLLS